MARKAVFRDYISPIRDILKSKNADRERELHKLIYHSRKILFKHTYRHYSVDLAVERLLDPAWIKQIQGFDVREWKALADLVWKRTKKIIGAAAKPDILLYPNFGGSNGRVYKLDKKPIIAFAPDFGFCRGKNLQCLIAHEYAHFIRYRKVGTPPEKQKIYSHIYEEGWAVYLTRKIFPELSPNIVFMSNLHHTIGLSDPKGGYLAWCRKHLKQIAEEALPVLSSNSYEDCKRFFQCGRFGHTKTPIRVGYYLGARMMEELARKFSLRQLYEFKPTARDVRKWLKNMFDSL
jgi:hypothetical protein